MKYFTDGNGSAWAFEMGATPEEDFPGVIAETAARRGVTLTPITDAEYESIINPPKSIDDLKAEKRGEVTRACAAAIIAGVVSDALGSPHTYPTLQTDQINLSANVVSSLIPGLSSDWTTSVMCANEAGEWEYRPHTVTQVQQVGVDVKTAILLWRERRNTLIKQINEAKTVEDVQAITW